MIAEARKESGGGRTVGSARVRTLTDRAGCDWTTAGELSGDCCMPCRLPSRAAPPPRPVSLHARVRARRRRKMSWASVELRRSVRRLLSARVSFGGEKSLRHDSRHTDVASAHGALCALAARARSAACMLCGRRARTRAPHIEMVPSLSCLATAHSHASTVRGAEQRRKSQPVSPHDRSGTEPETGPQATD